MSVFSPEKWCALPKTHKHRHTLSKCTECALTQREVQYSFPGPKYTPGKTLAQSVSILVEKNHSAKMLERTTTKEILAELEPLYKSAYGCSFTESLTTCRAVDLQRKPRRQNASFRGSVEIMSRFSSKTQIQLQFLLRLSRWLHTKDSVSHSHLRAQRVPVCGRRHQVHKIKNIPQILRM